MAKSEANILIESGLPLFFKLANAGEDLIAPPANRIGDALSTWVRSLSVMQKEAIVVSGRTGAAWRLASDEGGYLAGHDAAPCPLAFLTVGMIASYANEVEALARQRGIAIRGLRLSQDNHYAMAGSLLKGTLFGEALPAELDVEIDCDAEAGAIHELVLSAVAASPLNGLLRGALTSRFTLAHNGKELAPVNVAALGRPILPDPGDRFAEAQPAEPALDHPVVWHNGSTPKGEGVPVDPGSSEMGEARRLLRLSADCTLREDGIKEITQYLHSPLGSSFKFLSEEAPENGGQGRAPDANTLISAGIGFCFMTQFGRYVAMMKKNMEAYRIVQETHFSLGGASGGTGKPGSAEPVETHVYLQSGEPDGFAAEILDVAEQSCFLHALCRTDLKTKVRVRAMAGG